MTSEEAIEILQYEAYFLYDDDDSYNRQAFDMAIEALEEQKWISCSERLPDRQGEYLVTYHPCYWDTVSDSIEVGMDTFRGKKAWAKQKYQQVTAWMEKPKPYQEE